MLMDMREEVRDLDADLEDLEADVDAALEELADLVEDHHETLNRRIQNEQTERKEAVSSVENKLDQFDHRITQLEASIEAAEPLDLAMRLNQVESQMAQHDDELDHVWRRIGYNARELLDLNLAKLLSGGPDPTEPGENGPPQRHKFT
jgi:chromosome segregation ATPase